jgi:hypothetical protein
MADVAIRTTITANSIQRLFGPPGSVDYRTHPSDREPDAPSAIFKSMKTKETPPIPDIKIFKGTIYSFKNRRIITRWLRDVCLAFHLKLTTLCLAIQLADAYILRNLDKLPVNKCQLVGVAAMWIAAKFEEMDDVLPSLQSLVDVCDKAYSADDILNAEEDILNSFLWKLPHTTIANYLYLYLHMHGDPGIVTTLSKTPAVGLGSSPPDTISATLLFVDSDSKMRHTVSLAIPMGKAPLSQVVPQIIALLKLPSGKAGAVELFELFGQDFMVGRRLNLADTACASGWTSASRVTLFAATTAAAAAAGSTVFSERSSLVILRTVNALCIHVCESLAQEAATHVEFLRLPSHIVALGVIALGRAMTATSIEETRSAVSYLLRTLELSGALALAAADLLTDKYKEALEGGGLAPPVVPLPTDIQDRIKYVFSKNPSVA